MPPSTVHVPASNAHAFVRLSTEGSVLRIAAQAAALPVVRLVPLVFRQPAGRPVGLRSIAATPAVEGCDVLERDEDVAVELDVRDVVDVAVGSQNALLIFAAEEGDLDVLTLVFAGVVLPRASVYPAEGAVL